MTGEYSNHDRCENLRIQLKQYSSNPLCKYLLHHACQAKYEYELGITPIEMKYQCHPCINTHYLPLSKHNLVPINDDINEIITPAIDVVDLSMMKFVNESYKSTNSLESYGSQYGD